MFLQHLKTKKIDGTSFEVNPFKKVSQQTGFTLIETLVALTILTLIIIGPMTAAQKGIQNAYLAREQVIGTLLAQEAIEAVRQLRDDEALDAYQNPSETWDDTPGGWVYEFKDLCTAGCAYDPESQAFESCDSNTNNNCLLKIDANGPNQGTYNYHAGSPDSIFTRRVYVEDAILGDGGIKVWVDVSWSARGATRSVRLQSWVYDHYQRFET
jgi:prepilin-type N-terminal cleavage/methylation domain-containing protein